MRECVSAAVARMILTRGGVVVVATITRVWKVMMGLGEECDVMTTEE